MVGVIPIFVLPYEIEDFARTLNLLKRSSVFIDECFKLKVDITLCLSEEMTDWDASELPKSYIQERVEELCSVYLDWCEYKLFVENDDKIIGCLSHRRKSWEANPLADFFIWLDTDIFFNDHTLSIMLNAFRTLRFSGFEQFIVTPQIVRQWDRSWDILVNKKFLQDELNYHLNADIFQNALRQTDQTKILQIPIFKFAGGWFSMISKKLLDEIGLPVSLGHYGPDDSFIMDCSMTLKNAGRNVHQFVLENLVVGEIHKQQTNKTIRKNLASKNRKNEFRSIANSNFEIEFRKFIERKNIHQ